MERRIYGGILALALGWCLGAGIAPPPASAPAAPAGAAAVAAATAASQPAYRTKFAGGDSINDYFTAMAKRFDVMIVQPEALDAYILKDTELPDNFADALKTLRENLEPQGYAAIQSFSAKHLVVHVVSDKDAKRLALSESPVSYGTGEEKVDISDPQREVTHLFPVAHLELTDSLLHAARQDKDVDVEVTGGADTGENLILTGPALKVQQMVETLAKIDGIKDAPIIARTLQLQHLDAQPIADALNQAFAQNSAPMKAVVDQRTNSIVVTGPEDRVLEIMVDLIGQDARRGPLLPRPEAVPPRVEPPSRIEPPPRLPEIAPPPDSQPDESKPSAQRSLGRDGLDESCRGGDNGGPGAGVLAALPGGNFSPIVNQGGFLVKL